MSTDIDGFFGDYAFLSNFFESQLTFRGITWPTSEHAYQAMKSEDVVVHQAFALVSTPGKAKKLGRYVDLRPHWELVKDDCMFHIVTAKFQQNEQLKQLLLATENRTLVEGNNWGDKYWGMVRDAEGVWQGKNNLGKILMRVRSNLRGEGLGL